MSPVFSLLRSPINPLTRMYPGPPYPQIQPIQNNRIREEGGTPLPEIPVGGNHDEGFPVDEVPIPSFLCDKCEKGYAQRQGLNRHYRKEHDPSLCKYCDFEWSRPYEYRAHLKKHHPKVDRNEVLGKVKGSRRRAAIIARHRPQQDLPSDEHVGRENYGIRPYPSAMAHPPLDISSVTSVPQPELAQPIMMTRSIPEEERAYMTLTALLGAPPLQGGYSWGPSNSEMAINSALTPTLGGYYANGGSADFVDPLVGPVGSVYSPPPFVAGFVGVPSHRGPRTDIYPDPDPSRSWARPGRNHQTI